jgi:hypothetical protein
MMLLTSMCRKCGMLDITGDDEYDTRCGSSIGYFVGESHMGLPVVREVTVVSNNTIKRIYHGPEARGCDCSELNTIRVYLD